MKKYLSHILTMALIAPALVSCTERVEEVSPESLKHTVSFATADEAATKTGLAIEGSTIVPNWKQTSKDDVHLFEIDATSKTMGTTTAIQPSSDNLTARFKAEFFNAPGTYKYGAVVAKMNADDAFYIPAEQHPDAATLKDPAAEFLVGYSRFEYTAPTGDDDFLVDLFFDRVAALSRIGFTNFKGGANEKVLQVKIKSETSMTGSATIDKITFGNPSTVNFTADEGEGVLTLNYGEGVSVPSDGKFFAYFVSVPGTYKITGIEIQTDKYLYTKAPNANVTFTLTELKNLKVDLATTTIPVESVSLNKTELGLNVGATETLTATVLPDLASNKAVTWSSSAPGVATVNENGKVNAIAAGTAIITATTVDGGMTASCTVTVSDVYEYSLAITAEKSAINVNEELQYTATLTTIKNHGDPVEEVLTTGVTWSSLSEAIASITAQGLAKGLAGGLTTIKASYEPEHADEPVTATVELTVNDVVTYSLAVTADKTVINYKETSVFTAMLTTTTNGNAVVTDVTAEAEWTSSDVSVATLVDNIATGKNGGTTTIKATYNGISDEVDLTVNNVVTYSLEVTATEDEIDYNQTSEFTAMLTTTTNDISVVTNVTANAEWTSSNESVATLAGNIATGKKGGTTIIKATYNGYSDEVTLTVNDVITYSIAIDPNQDVRVIIDQQKQFTLYLTTITNDVPDEEATVVTSGVTWSSSSDAVASINNSGEATGLKEGTVTITAKYTPTGYQQIEATTLLTVIKDPNHAGDPIVIGDPEEL